MLSREQKLNKRFDLLGQICCKKVKDTFFGGAEKEAGKAIQASGREAAAVTRELFGETKEQLLPFIEGGQPAFQQQQALSGALGPEAQAEAFTGFQEDPGTEFLREQGLRLVNTGAAVSGNVGGGERLRELTKFSQGLALQDLSNRFNRLGAVTGTGLTAAQALGGVSSGAASGISQAVQAAGAGKAAGITGQAAGLRAGISDTAKLAAGFSDRSLKKNIKKIGVSSKGFNLFSWEWNDIAASLGLFGESTGVIAQEVKETMPEAVGYSNGYLYVNYSMVM